MCGEGYGSKHYFYFKKREREKEKEQTWGGLHQCWSQVRPKILYTVDWFCKRSIG